MRIGSPCPLRANSGTFQDVPNDVRLLGEGDHFGRVFAITPSCSTAVCGACLSFPSAPMPRPTGSINSGGSGKPRLTSRLYLQRFTFFVEEGIINTYNAWCQRQDAEPIPALAGREGLNVSCAKYRQRDQLCPGRRFVGEDGRMSAHRL
jgi:hypothetical protein